METRFLPSRPALISPLLRPPFPFIPPLFAGKRTIKCRGPQQGRGRGRKTFLVYFEPRNVSCGNVFSTFCVDRNVHLNFKMRIILKFAVS